MVPCISTRVLVMGVLLLLKCANWGGILFTWEAPDSDGRWRLLGLELDELEAASIEDVELPELTYSEAEESGGVKVTWEMVPGTGSHSKS